MKNQLLGAALAALVAFSLSANASSENNSDGMRAVLITGASSGIGRHAAEQLAGAGYYVYAGARKDSDLAELNAIENVHAVRLDVTRQDEIDAAFTLIESEGRGLWGLVNNAGVNVIDPLIEAREQDLEFLFDVNVYGVYRVTKAFAPLIIDSKGRIVNISSISGILSGGLTGYGMYTMSKHAVEAYTDQLAFEMAPLGVNVSAVEPGNFRSEIGVTRCKRMLRQIEGRTYRYFGEAMGTYAENCRKYLAGDFDESLPPPPKAVSDAIQHALFDQQPKAHYLVVPEVFQARITIMKLFEELLHLNHAQEYSFTREELIAIMDEEWAILKGEKERKRE